MKRGALVIGIGIGIVFAIGPARADVAACDAAYAHGQDLRAAAKLREARETFLHCADEACEAQQRTDCSKWIEELDAQIPSILPVVQTETGRDVADATVTLDGVVIANALSGSPIRIDPGAHTLVIVKEGARRESSFVARTSELGRRIVVTFPSPPTRRPVPWSAGLFAGVSLASFVAAGIVGAVALSERSSLSWMRGRFCDQSAVDSVTTKYWVTDALLGVGVVAIALAAVLYVTRPSVPMRSPALAWSF